MPRILLANRAVTGVSKVTFAGVFPVRFWQARSVGITNDWVGVAIFLFGAHESISVESFFALALVRGQLGVVQARSVQTAVVDDVTTDRSLYTLCDSITDVVRFTRTVVSLVLFIV